MQALLTPTDIASKKMGLVPFWALCESLKIPVDDTHFELYIPQNSLSRDFASRNLKSILLKSQGPSDSKLLRTSITHSNGLCLGLRFSQEHEIGIDVEARDRFISPLSINKKLILDCERHFDLSPVQRWVLKEATFKADFKNPNPRLVSQYQIESWDSKNSCGEIVFPMRKAETFKTFLWESPEWIGAISIKSGHQSKN